MKQYYNSVVDDFYKNNVIFKEKAKKLYTEDNKEFVIRFKVFFEEYLNCNNLLSDILLSNSEIENGIKKIRNEISFIDKKITNYKEAKTKMTKIIDELISKENSIANEMNIENVDLKLENFDNTINELKNYISNLKLDIYKLEIKIMKDKNKILKNNNNYKKSNIKSLNNEMKAKEFVNNWVLSKNNWVLS